MPLRLPEPVQEPALWAVVLFMVPATNPAPVAVQVTLGDGEWYQLPEVRSPPARTVRVALAERCRF